MEKKSSQLAFWYFTEVHYCKNCGNNVLYRERRYGHKPENIEDRSCIIEYDQCGACLGETNEI